MAASRPMPNVRAALALANATDSEEFKLYAYLVNVEGIAPKEAKAIARRAKRSA